MKHYPKVRRPGHPDVDGLFANESHELVVTEKFDGNNFRFSRDGDELLFGSRNVVMGTLEDDELANNDMFDDVAEYVADVIDAEDLEGLEMAIGVDGVVLFGENAVQHTIEDYQWESVPQFQLFDIWVDTGDDGYWLEWDSVETHAENLGLETVPVVERTTVEEFSIAEFEIPSSVYRPGDGVAEGVVIRNVRTGAKAKSISEEFAEKHESAKSKNNALDQDTQAFLDRHVTRRRVEKNVQKLLESPDHDYEGVQMEMMQHLATKVWEDVWSEDWADIIYENWEIDIGDLRSETSSKTASILQDLLTEQVVVDPSTGETAGQHLTETKQ